MCCGNLIRWETFETTTEPQIEQQELRTIGDCPIKEALSSNSYPGSTTPTWPQVYQHFKRSTILSVQTLNLLNKGLWHLCWLRYSMHKSSIISFNLLISVFFKRIYLKHVQQNFPKNLRHINKILFHACETCPIITHASSRISISCNVMTKGHPWSHIRILLNWYVPCAHC